jgi:hypothetical protein
MSKGNQMFAKLFSTTQGQFLLQKFDEADDENYSYDIKITFNAISPIPEADAVVTKTLNYGDTDEGLENRDLDFDEFTQEKAEGMSNQPL